MLDYCYDETVDCFNECVDAINKKDFTSRSAINFLAYEDYDDLLSHNEIDDRMYELKIELSKYINENHRGEYAIWVDWCVHVSSKEFAEINGLGKYIVY